MYVSLQKKINTATFMELVAEALTKEEFVTEEGNILFIKELNINEDQNIILINLSDNSEFTLKINDKSK